MRFNSDQIQKIGKEISSKVDGKTLFDEFSRGRYSTDASVYQITPLGVVLPCLLYTSPSPRDVP